GERAGPALADVEPAGRRARAHAARAGEDLVGVVDDAVAIVVAAVAGFGNRRAHRATARHVVDDAVAVVVDTVAHLGGRIARRGAADGVQWPAADHAKRGIAARLGREAAADFRSAALAGADSDGAGGALVVALVDHAVAVVVHVVTVLDQDRALNDLG